MEQLLNTYGLDSAFMDLLRQPGILLAGSSALSIYLREEQEASVHAVEPAIVFEPHDLDLYVAVHRHRSFLSLLHQPIMNQVYQYCIGQGYDIDVSEESKDLYGSYPCDDIGCLLTLRSRTVPVRRIQVIGVHCAAAPVPDGFLVDFLKASCDLSCCMTWWDAAAGRCATMDPEGIRLRRMRVMNPIAESHPQYASRMPLRAARIEKYTARGFTIAEEAPSVIAELDPRDPVILGAFEGCRAYDVIALEEVDAAAWLRASPWNLLVRVSNAFHAFDRRTLHRCMSTAVSDLPRYGVVYDTPHHQSVPEEALDLLLYGDWSVYELEHEHTVVDDHRPNRQKSLYRVQCCTVAQYMQGETGWVILPPPPLPPLPAVHALEDRYDSDDDMPALMDDTDEEP